MKSALHVYSIIDTMQVYVKPSLRFLRRFAAL